MSRKGEKRTMRASATFIIGIAAALSVAAGSQLTGGGGLTRVALSSAPGNLARGSGNSANPLDVELSVGSGLAGTGSAGSALALSSTGVAAGNYTLASLNVDGAGRLTSAANGAVALSSAPGNLARGSGNSANPLDVELSVGSGLAGTGSAGSALSLPTTGVTAASYTLANVTVDARGRVTAASNGVVAGRRLNRQILAATGTYFPTPGATIAHVTMIGGGGGGGGATAGAGVGGAAGGSSGVLLDIWVGTSGTPLTGGAFTAGAGGVGGATTGGVGGTGGDSTLVVNGATFVAKGGAGGDGIVGVTGNADPFPHAPATGTSSGGLTTYGLGGFGVVQQGNAWVSGHGGGTALGAGGLGIGGNSAGNPGLACGGGGGGAATQSGGRAGGAGGAGCIVIDEFS